MMRNRLAAVVAFALFLVLTGTGVSNASWSTHATARASVQVASVASNCTNVATLLNGSFEAPAIAETWYRNVPAAEVPGWDTTDPVGIEVWKSGGGGGVSTPAGNQFVELNASRAGTLSQSIATTPGQTLSWSLLHRGRAGVDVMEVRLGASTTTGTLQGSLSDGMTWGRHSGTYVVPTGQTTTVLSLTAVSTEGGNISVGNFLDDIAVGTGPCLTATTTLTNITGPGTNPATSPRYGDTLEYTTTVTNIGGAPSALTQISGTLPSGLTFQSGSLRTNGSARTDATGDDTAEHVAPSRKFTARLGLGASPTGGGAIAPAESATFTLRAVVTATTDTERTIRYAEPIAVTSVDPLAPQWPMTVSPPTVTSTIASAADLVMSQTVVNAAPLPGGANPPRWTATVTNSGPQTATSVIVRVVVPEGLANPIVTPDTGVTCAVVAGAPRTWACAAGELTLNQSKSITVTGTVAGTTSAGVRLTVTATATGSLYDPVAANSTAPGVATVAQPIVNAASWYQIRTNGSSQYCLDANGGGSSAGTALTQWTCQTVNTEKLQQRWKFALTPDGYYSVQRYGAQVYWQAASNAIGAPVSLQNATTSAQQQWSIKPAGTTGKYQFVNRSSGLCLTTEAVRMVTCDTNSTFQLYTFAIDTGL
jgi:uncharacterized repeat protein (TIGR01451 family)